MSQQEYSIPASTDRQRFPERLDPDRFHGLVALVVGSSGLLLVAVGSNLVRDRAPFESDWHENGEPGPVSVAVLVVLTASVVAASLAWTLS